MCMVAIVAEVKVPALSILLIAARNQKFLLVYLQIKK